MSNHYEAFPLYWPVGYKRTKTRIWSRFKVTMDKAWRTLHAEINRLGGSNLIVSTNIPVRKSDGGFYADWMNKKIDDPGVAIYFKYKGRDVSMCCDQYEKVWENLYALAKGIENLRGIERWGISEFMERSFTGFAELPDPNKVKSWWEMLGVEKLATENEIKTAFRELAKTYHPDNGGDSNMFIRIKAAYDEAMRQFV